MKWRNYSSRPAMLAMLALGLLLGLDQTTFSQPQPQRISLEGGGVIDDIQTLEVGSDDIVWAASMGTGLFRVKWESSSWDHTWTENLAGKGIFGLDAIYQSSTEYVLAGTAYNGIYFASSANGTFSSWLRPNVLQGYPQAWNNIRAHDVAFYCNTNGSYETNPEDKYFVIYRNNDLSDGPNGYKLGIYRWRDDPYYDFVRVDMPYYYDLSRQFDHFYRDKKDPNVLYVTSPDGLYKLYGSYTSPKFEKLPADTKLEDLPITRPPAGLPPLPPCP